MKKLTLSIKFLLFALVILNCSFINNSKSHILKETVIDCAINITVVDANDNEPLAGATVRVSTVGTSTDIDGKAKLTLPTGYNKIIVTYVGYQAQEVTVWCGFTGTIKLIPSN